MSIPRTQSHARSRPIQGWHRTSRRASVLILVLWMVIILGVTGLSYTFSVRNQTSIAESVRNKKEAYWAARAGIEKARAVFSQTDLSVVAYNREPFQNEMGENIWADQWIGHAMYSVGFADETGRVNINTADYDTLMRLPAMSSARAQALMDWVDKDSRARAEGAEADYYLELDPPYEPRNGPLTSINELRRIRGWADVFRAAWPDPYSQSIGGEEAESAGYVEGEMEEIDGEQARLLFNAITVWSANPKEEKAPDGRDKLDLNSASVDQMKRKVPSMSTDEAQAIVDHRQKKAFSAVFDLFDVAPPVTKTSGDGSSGRGRSSQTRNSSRRSSSSGRSGGSGSSGSSRSSGSSSARMFDLDRVGQIIDYFTVGSSGSSSSGTLAKININTAGGEALMVFPQMTWEMVEAIAQRRDQEPFTHPGQIAEITGIDESAFRKVYALITTTSTRFRVHAWGRSGSESAGANAQANIETVFQVASDGVRVVYWREN